MTTKMDDETEKLVQRWIVAFCEMPIIVDPELMRAVLDAQPGKEKRR